MPLDLSHRHLGLTIPHDIGDRQKIIFHGRWHVEGLPHEAAFNAEESRPSNIMVRPKFETHCKLLNQSQSSPVHDEERPVEISPLLVLRDDRGVLLRLDVFTRRDTDEFP